jgi:cytoskeletal protein RodZ
MFEIGSSLREARLRQGLDFPEIEAGTKIRGKYLRALEDEQFAQLPAQTYVKGFLRTYAEYLGLDGELYVDEFNSRYVVGEDEPPIRARRTARPHVRKRVQSNVLLAALVGIALLTALVIAAWKSGSPPATHVAGTSTPPTNNQAKTPSATAPASITLRGLRSGSLVLIRKGGARGKVLFNEGLSAGQTKNFTTKKLWINAATPENLRITVNAKRVKLPVGGPKIFVVTSRGIPAA